MHGYNKFPVTADVIGYSTEDIVTQNYQAIIRFRGKTYRAKTSTSEQNARNLVLNSFVDDNKELRQLVDKKYKEVIDELIKVGASANFQLANTKTHNLDLGSPMNMQVSESLKMQYYNDKINDVF